jgi:flagellin-like hook-associated protein FlgL
MAGLSVSSLLDPSQLSAITRYRELGSEIAKNNQRISTMRRINSAADDPSGMVSAAVLKQEMDGLESLVGSLRRGSSRLEAASSTAGEIISQLQAARAIAVEVAGGALSATEVAGKQSELDSILRGIDTLAGTEFEGKRLLDGSSGFRTTGVNGSQFASIQVLDRQTTSDVAFNVNVTAAATRATNSYSGGTLGGASTVTVSGPDGETTIALAAGADTTAITAAFNAATHLTGVQAVRVDATNINFNTVDYGTAAKLNIQVNSGTFALGTPGETAGTDAVATINGQSVTGKGTTFTVNSQNTAVAITTAATATGTLSAFTVSGTGTEYVLNASATSKARLGLPDLNVANLNGVNGTLSSVQSGGSNNLTANAANAVKVIDDAINLAATATSMIGAFQKYTLGSSQTVAIKTNEFLGKSYNDVAGTDVAIESALLANNQLLQQATLQSLQIFAQQNESVIALLRSTALRL